MIAFAVVFAVVLAFAFVIAIVGLFSKTTGCFEKLIPLFWRLFFKLFRLYIGCIVGIILTRTSKFRSERCIGGTYKMKILYHKCLQKSIKTFKQEHFLHDTCSGGYQPPATPDFRKHPDERICLVGADRIRPQPNISEPSVEWHCVGCCSVHPTALFPETFGRILSAPTVRVGSWFHPTDHSNTKVPALDKGKG